MENPVATTEEQLDQLAEEPQADVQHGLEVRAERDALVDVLSRANRGIGTRAAMPILQGLLCEALGDQLQVTGSSLEVTVRTAVQVNVISEGKCVIPGKLITDAIRKMPEGAITLKQTDSTLEVSGLGSSDSGPRFSIRLMSVEDYPSLDTPDISGAFTVSGDDLTAAIAQVTMAASTDEARPILTGVQIESENGGMRMVATDSYRLAVKDLEGVEISQPGLVPARGLNELKQTIVAKEVQVVIDDRTAVFSSERGTLSLRLIDGTFPNYRQLLPDSHPNRVIFPKDAVLAAIARAELVAEDHIPIRLRLTKQGAHLTVKRQDVGEETELIPGEMEGEEEEIDVAFNPAYMRDGVSAIGVDEITLDLLDGLKPGLIRGKGKEDFQYLLMPVRV